MTTETIQLGTIGLKITVTVQENTVAKDISTALNIVMRLRSDESNTYKEFTPSFETDGTDGQVSYTTVAADNIDVSGLWSVQIYYEMGAFKGFTEPVPAFMVLENL